jgi:hypothetical protein
MAARFDELASAQLLVAAGADVNALSARGLTATDEAVATASPEFVTFLLANGGRITRIDDAFAEVAGRFDSKRDAVFEVLLGLSPKLGPSDFRALHTSARRGLVALASKLLKAGANPDVPEPKSQQTPLMSAIRGRQSAVAVELTALAGNVDAVDAKGSTALMYAAEQSDVAFAKALLARKASQTLKNADGKTAAVLAEEARSLEVLSLLAPDQATPGVDAIIWGGGVTQADGEKWMKRWADEAASMAKLLTLAPGYPQLVKSDEVPGLKPGFMVVVLGTCEGVESRYTLGLLKGVAERVYARRIKTTVTACPLRTNGLQRARMAVTTAAGGTRLQAAEVWDPKQPVFNETSPRASSVWVTLRTKEGELLDQLIVPGTSSTCPSLTLESSEGALELVTQCDAEVNGGRCATDSGAVTTRFSVNKGKLKKVVEDPREERCHDFYIGGCD